MADSSSGIAGVATAFGRSQLLRVLVVGMLVLGLQVPILLVHQQIRARRATRDEAVAEVTGRWGGEQHVLGPVLRIPWRERRLERDGSGHTLERIAIHHATFLPEALQVTADVQAETRYRGIFDVPVYRGALELRGSFRAADFSDWDVPAGDVLWDKAELLLVVADARALASPPVLTWNGASVPFEPGGAPLADCGSSLRARLPEGQAAHAARFRLALGLNGATRLSLAPVGDVTTATLSSNWPHPSFDGRWLPVARQVRPDGFEARWEVAYLGRGYPQHWRDAEVADAVLREAAFGAAFLAPVDPYRMAERSVKYEVLFLGLPFLAIWLFEVLTGLRVHPIQYLFVGAALCLFYLLQLSLAEHLGFAAAYALASGAVVAMVGLYARAFLAAGRRAAVLAALVATLYGFLYVLLREQDYALLLGSLGLFAALAAAMWLTRSVDWYRLDQVGAPRP